MADQIKEFFDRFNEAPAPLPPDRNIDTFFRRFSEPEAAPVRHPGMLANDAEDGMATSVAKNAATGAIKGAAGAVGTPDVLWSAFSPQNAYDRASFARGMATDFMNWVTGRKDQDVVWADPATDKFVTAEAKKKGMVDVKSGLPETEAVEKAALAKTGEYQPTSMPERVFQRGVEFATGNALLPLGPGVGTAKGLAAASAREIPSGFLFGAGVGGAKEAGVENPAGQMAAGIAATIAGRGVGNGVGNLARKGYGAAVDTYGPGWEAQPARGDIPASPGNRLFSRLPGVEGSTERAAAPLMQSTASDPKAALAALDREPAELVSGSRPTLGQVTADPGIMNAERVAQTGDEGFKHQWLGRMGEQQLAQRRALEGIQPEGDVGAVPKFFGEADTRRLAAADQKIAELADIAKTRADDLGGFGSTDSYGNRIRAVLQPIWERATDEARGAVAGLGGTDEIASYGARLRNAVMDNRATAASVNDAIWNDIRARHNLTIPADIIRGQAQSIYGEMTDWARRSVAPEEISIMRGLARQGDVVSLGELKDMRSLVAANMRELRPVNDAAHRRLTMVLRSIDSALDDSVDIIQRREAEAVAQGAMQPADTTQAFARWLADEIEKTYAARGEAELGRSIVGRSGVDIGQAPAGGSARYSGAPGGGRPGEPVFRGDARAEGVPEEVVNPPTREDIDLIRRGRATHADLKRRYDEGPVGEITAKGPTGGTFDLTDANVPSRVFAPGKEGAERIRAYRAAVGNNAAFNDAMHNYAAHTLRSDARAIRPDGTLDPASFARWRTRYGEALREVPEVEARFRNAATASEALNRFAPFDPSIAPARLPEMFFTSGTAGAAGVRDLRRLIGDAPANEILSDYVASHLRGGKGFFRDGMVDGKALAAWKAQHRWALDEMPELRDKLASAASATEMVGEAAVRRKAALDSYQKSAFGKLAGMAPDDDVARVVGTIMERPDGVSQMQRLSRAVAGNPEAAEGLRKAVVDRLSSRLLSQTEAFGTGENKLASATFQKYVKAHEKALVAALGRDHVDVLNRIAADLNRQQRSIVGTALPARSNTVADAVALLKSDPRHQPMTWWQAVSSNYIPTGGLLGYFVGWKAALGIGTAAWASNVVNGAKQAGLSNVRDLLHEGLMNPEVGRALLAKVPPAGVKRPPLVNALARNSLFATSAANRGEDR